MGAETAIGWTDHTFNPWWGCSRVSPGCQHCYAEAFAKRTGNDVWGKNGPRRLFGEKHWLEPEKWNRKAEEVGRPALVFCASMADVFEDHPVVIDDRARLFDLIERTPWLRWQLLTKRPENVLGMVPARWIKWPANAWIGTTVEDQQRADERVPILLDIPAPVRFLSCEPLLGPVTLNPTWMVPPAIICGTKNGPTPTDLAIVRAMGEHLGGRYLDWIIVGGESGPGHRPLDLDHAADLCAQVLSAGVPLFFKQVGGHRPTTGGDAIDPNRLGQPRTFKQFPFGAER